MIVQKYTRLFLSEHRKVESGVIIQEEGQAMVNVKENGETVVRPSTGAAGEFFAGISMARNTPPTTLQWVANGVVPDTGAVELPRTPLTGQILVKVGTTAATISAGAPASAAETQLAGDVITFHADNIGKNYFVQIAYEPGMQEALQLVGSMPIGGLAATYQGIVGVITRGEVATSFYDAASDWSTAIQVKLGADGRFTTSGPGAVVPGLTVINAPSSENTALTLRVNV